MGWRPALADDPGWSSATTSVDLDRPGSGKDEDDAFHGRWILRAPRSGLHTLEVAVPGRMRVAEVGIHASLIEGIGRVAVGWDDELELDALAGVGEDRMGIAIEVGPGDLGALFDGDGQRLEPV